MVMDKRKLSLVIVFFFLLFNCEKLEDINTTVSGKVYEKNCTVVIAIKSDSSLFSYVDKIENLDEKSLLNELDIVRGFDHAIDVDSLYNITMLSFGETYFLGVMDNGLEKEKLDTLDQVGFYGKSDTTNILDSTFVYSVPEKVNIQEGIDKSHIDIRNFVKLKWLIRLYQETD